MLTSVSVKGSTSMELSCATLRARSCWGECWLSFVPLSLIFPVPSSKCRKSKSQEHGCAPGIGNRNVGTAKIGVVDPNVD